MSHDRGVDIVVQQVWTSWTKDSRGGAAAGRRNATPNGFLLPDHPAPFIHKISMGEWAGFHPHDEIRPGLPGDNDWLTLRCDGERLRVQLTVNPWGMPRRWRRPPAVNLSPGEWIRWQINYRFTGASGGDWSYRLETLNLFHGTSPDADIFLAQPDHDIKELGPLR